MSESSQYASEFLTDLDREIAWQWKWERRYRRLTLGFVWATWIVRLLILAMATFQLAWRGKGGDQLWAIFTLAVLSVLNFGLPWIPTQLRYQQRQEVYDSHAREYSAIRLEFLAGQIDLSGAVEKFNKIRRLPTEAIIRKTI